MKNIVYETPENVKKILSYESTSLLKYSTHPDSCKLVRRYVHCRCKNFNEFGDRQFDYILWWITHLATLTLTHHCQSGCRDKRSSAIAARLAVTPVFSQVGIVLDNAACRYLGDLWFFPPLHSGAASFSPHFTLFGSQDLKLASVLASWVAVPTYVISAFSRSAVASQCDTGLTDVSGEEIRPPPPLGGVVDVGLGLKERHVWHLLGCWVNMKLRPGASYRNGISSSRGRSGHRQLVEQRGGGGVCDQPLGNRQGADRPRECPADHAARRSTAATTCARTAVLSLLEPRVWLSHCRGRRNSTLKPACGPVVGHEPYHSSSPSGGTVRVYIIDSITSTLIQEMCETDTQTVNSSRTRQQKGVTDQSAPGILTYQTAAQTIGKLSQFAVANQTQGSLPDLTQPTREWPLRTFHQHNDKVTTYSPPVEAARRELGPSLRVAAIGYSKQEYHEESHRSRTTSITFPTCETRDWPRGDSNPITSETKQMSAFTHGINWKVIEKYMLFTVKQAVLKALLKINLHTRLTDPRKPDGWQPYVYVLGLATIEVSPRPVFTAEFFLASTAVATDASAQSVIVMRRGEATHVAHGDKDCRQKLSPPQNTSAPLRQSDQSYRIESDLTMVALQFPREKNFWDRGLLEGQSGVTFKIHTYVAGNRRTMVAAKTELLRETDPMKCAFRFSCGYIEDLSTDLGGRRNMHQDDMHKGQRKVLADMPTCTKVGKEYSQNFTYVQAEQTFRQGNLAQSCGTPGVEQRGGSTERFTRFNGGDLPVSGMVKTVMVSYVLALVRIARGHTAGVLYPAGVGMVRSLGKTRKCRGNHDKINFAAHPGDVPPIEAKKFVITIIIIIIIDDMRAEWHDATRKEYRRASSWWQGSGSDRRLVEYASSQMLMKTRAGGPPAGSLSAPHSRPPGEMWNKVAVQLIVNHACKNRLRRIKLARNLYAKVSESKVEFISRMSLRVRRNVHPADIATLRQGGYSLIKAAVVGVRDYPMYGRCRNAITEIPHTINLPSPFLFVRPEPQAMIVFPPNWGHVRDWKNPCRQRDVPASVLSASLYSGGRLRIVSKPGWRKPASLRSRGGVVVRLLASHLGEPGSIPCGIAPVFSHVGIVPDDATGQRVFLVSWLRRWSEEAALIHTPGSGCQRRSYACIVRAAIADRTAIVEQIRLNVAQGVSARSICNRLREAGLPSREPLARLPLSPQHRAARPRWCRKRSTWRKEWRSVVFSNEKKPEKFASSVACMLDFAEVSKNTSINYKRNMNVHVCEFQLVYKRIREILGSLVMSPGSVLGLMMVECVFGVNLVSGIFYNVYGNDTRAKHLG
ncbi:hypothetical protein PR048_006386 [Dryococelus australis]|uniref:Uncharacterized protein n=1 Tax=Dryococelus australis TaxID=614101 RepID=A0ABQ9IC61_9NEOP|nr:hypothetical protein PR048_006386 [Dryococelus australis]